MTSVTSGLEPLVWGGIRVWPFRKRREKSGRNRVQSSSNMIVRGGRPQKADAVWHAWVSGDLKKMLKVAGARTNPVDRHFLLQNIVKETYKRRKNDARMRDLCEQMAFKHLEEFPGLVDPLVQNIGGRDRRLPRVTTFQHLATVLMEKGEYRRAIEVCEMALSYGLDDGTKGGFTGRIERLKKKMR